MGTEFYEALAEMMKTKVPSWVDFEVNTDQFGRTGLLVKIKNLSSLMPTKKKQSTAFMVITVEGNLVVMRHITPNKYGTDDSMVCKCDMADPKGFDPDEFVKFLCNYDISDNPSRNGDNRGRR